MDLAVLCEPTLGLARTQIMDIVGREIGVDVDVIDMGSASPQWWCQSFAGFRPSEAQKGS